MSETNCDYSTEPYDLEKASEEERIANSEKEKTGPKNMVSDSVKQPTDPVK